MTGKTANAVRGTELLHEDLDSVRKATLKAIHYIEGDDSDDSDHQRTHQRTHRAAPADAGDLDEEQGEDEPIAESIKSSGGG
jgi:hypothetical protein